MPAQPVTVLLHVVRALEDIGIPYAVVGSFASSMHGITRATMDADIVLDLPPDQVDAFVARLVPDFYADPEMLREAIARRGHANVIHLGSMFKVDLFVADPTGHSHEELRRRSRARLDPLGGEAFFASAEDVILHKLLWYRLGGEVSDRQWSDVVGVLKVQGTRLDDGYLDRWAVDLSIADLLVRARSEAVPG